MAFKINPFMQLMLSSSTHPVPYEHWVFDQFVLPTNARILEVGCNGGHLWINNVDRIPRDAFVLLSDIEPEFALATARDLVESPRRLAFMALDVSDLPDSLGLFDVAIANRLIHTISMDWQDRLHVIYQLRSRLKDTGVLYAATNGDKDFEDLNPLIQEFDERCVFQDGNADAFGYFCLENGEWQLKHAFDHVEAVTYDDVLEIKDANLLYHVAMRHSKTCKSHIKGRRRGRFRRFLADRIERDGCIRVRRSTGMFIARP